MKPQRDYWDRVATEKVFSHPLQAHWLAPVLLTDAVILDYGCGYGRTVAELLAAGFSNSIGADVSSAMLKRAREVLPDANLIQCDGHIFPFASESIDAILVFALLTCIPDSSGQFRLLSEIIRVLRPGGVLYISDLLINSDTRNRERYERDVERFGCYGVFELPEGVIVRHHSRDWIEQLTTAFEMLEWENFNVTTMNGNQSAAFQYLGRKPAAYTRQTLFV